MTNNWQNKTPGKATLNFKVDDAHLDKTGVILVHGTNTFGDAIFSYLELSMRKLQDMKEALDRNENIKPSDFGTVLAAGRGHPPQELQDEMAAKYNLVPVPTTRAAPARAFAPPPSFSYGNEDED